MRKILYVIATLMLFFGTSSAQIHLFQPQSKEPNREFVYDFLERYLGKVSSMKELSEIIQMLASDKVFLVSGSIADIPSLPNATAFDLSCIEDKVYYATWTLDDKNEFCLVFPVNFELLLDSPKHVIEKDVHKELQQIADSLIIEPIDPDQLQSLDNGLYQTIPSNFYYIKELNDNRYYLRDSIGYVPVFDSHYLAESMANLFQTYMDRNYRIGVHQNIYGFKHLDYEVTLSQWLAYCKRYEMRTYVAVEDVLEKEIKLVVLAECKMLGFNDVLSVIVPKDIFTNPDVALKAKLNAFIPTHNLRNLYQPIEAKDTIQRKIQIQR